MTRKELYAEVKKYNLSRQILMEYGNNFTRVPSMVLEDYIRIAKEKETKKVTKPSKLSEKSANLKEAFVTLVTKLRNYRILSDANVSEILEKV